MRNLHMLTRSGSLTVNVFAADGTTPIEDATVRVRDIANGVDVAVAWLAERAGRERAGSMPSRQLSHASAGMRVSALVYVGGAEVTAEAVASFDPGPGQARTVTLIVPVGTVTGTVFENDGVTVVEGASVRVTQVGSPGNPNQIDTSTDAEGQFTASGVIAGPVAIEATHPASLQVATVVGTVSNPTLGPTTINVTFGPTGTVTGIVTRRGGELAEGARVALSPTEMVGGSAGSAGTDANGVFTIEGVPLGTFTLQVCVDEDEGTDCVGVPGEVVTADQVVQKNVAMPGVGTVNIALGEDNGEGEFVGVQGSVNVTSGQMGPSERAERSADTDVDGVVVIPSLPVGYHLVSALDANGQVLGFDFGVLPAPGATVGIEVWRGPEFVDNINGDPVVITDSDGRSYQFSCDFSFFHSNTESWSLIGMWPLRVNGNNVDCLPQRVQYRTCTRDRAVLDGRTPGDPRRRRGGWHACRARGRHVLQPDQRTRHGGCRVHVDAGRRGRVPAHGDRQRRSLRHHRGEGNTRELAVQVFAGTDPTSLKPTLVDPQVPGGRQRVRFRVTIPANQRSGLVYVVAQVDAADESTASALAAAVALAEAISNRTDVVWQSPAAGGDAPVLNFPVPVAPPPPE